MYSVAIFWEEGFPEIQGFKITRDILQQSLTAFTIQYLSEQELITRLNTDRFDLFINPYGSAFPKRAWPEKLARQGLWEAKVELKIENTQATGSIDVPRTTTFRPGYYSVQGNVPVRSQAYAAHLFQNLAGVPTTGFWFYDEALMRRGKPLTVDNNFFYRGGECLPSPVQPTWRRPFIAFHMFISEMDQDMAMQVHTPGECVDLFCKGARRTIDDGVNRSEDRRGPQLRLPNLLSVRLHHGIRAIRG